MRLGINVDSFSLRGVDQASYEYARMCQEILGIDVVIVRSHKKESKWISDMCEDKFRSSFRVYDYDGSREGLRSAIEILKLDAVYTLNSGILDERFRDVPAEVWNHCVFPTPSMKTNEPNFAVISEWLSGEYFGGQVEFVPHIVPRFEPRIGLRSKLGIPESALVVGTMGGKLNFDSRTATGGLATALEKRKDMWFISLNQLVCHRHERLAVLPGTGDDCVKSAFITACDYMLHGRTDGETFGIACGEFARAGKPVIAWEGSPQRAHIQQFVLPEFKYHTKKRLIEILCDLQRNDEELEMRCRSLGDSFSSARVADRFNNVFVKHGAKKVDHRPSNHLKSIIRRLRRRIRVENMKRDRLLVEEFRSHYKSDELRE